MQSVLQKIDRVAKPIRKNNKVVSENLNAKNIFLEEENFDILKLLQSRQADNKEGTRPSIKPNPKRKRDSPHKQPQDNLKRPKIKELNKTEMITPKKVSPGILTPENRASPQVEYGRMELFREGIQDFPEKEVIPEKKRK